jgi:hypothetical protein
MVSTSQEQEPPFWTVCHGDTDVPLLFWCGWVTARKEHVFERSSGKAIRFCRLEDARQAGVGLTKGTRYVCVNPTGDQPWPIVAMVS